MKERLDQLVSEGFVNAIASGPLTLYNYSDKAVWEKKWTPETLAARGLVIHRDGDIIARPWPKFFNVGEQGFAAHELPAEVPELADKHDGSLVIAFWNPVDLQWTAVTRGCWDNQQTRTAQAWMTPERTKKWSRQHTYLFELVAPWNRIVLCYEREDMIFLGCVNNATGADCSYADAAYIAQHHGFTPCGYETRPLSSLNLADESVTTAEGFVARFSNGLRVKLKYAEYLRLHKLLTGMSVLAIWEGLAAGNDAPPEGVPDEFMAWWTANRNALVREYDKLELKTQTVFRLRPGGSRKDNARAFTQYPDIAPALFSMLDNKDHRPALWKRVRPHGNAAVFSGGVS